MSALDLARQLRMEILKILEPDLKWAYGDFEGETIMWLPSYLATEFDIVDSSPDGLEVATLIVRTRLLEVSDEQRALFICKELNFYTATTRWYVANGELLGELALTVGSKTMKIDALTASLMVAEQVAKSAALLDEQFYGNWGKPIYRLAEGEFRDFEEWSSACSYFENVVLPHGERPMEKLFNCAVKAFEAERDFQLHHNVPAWLGNHDPELQKLVFEVPYGRGDFPAGVIFSVGNLEFEDCETALVSIDSVAHPSLGNGTLVRMQIISRPGIDDLQLSVNALNQQHLEFPGFGHCIGAWTVRDEAVDFITFIPAGWSEVLVESDLVSFYQELFCNLARTAWASGFQFDNRLRNGTSRNFGLAVNPGQARGPQYGELGY